MFLPSFLNSNTPIGLTYPGETLNDDNPSPSDGISVDSSSDDVGQPTDVSDETNREYVSNSYYYYNPSLKSLADSALSFLTLNLLNLTDDGYTEYVNLTGPTNSTLKLTTDNALMISALIRSYEADTSKTEYLDQANETAYFMLSNLFIHEPITYKYAFIYSVAQDLSVNDATLNLSSNALAIIALCELYQFTKDETLSDACYQAYDYINEQLWDSQYGGYFKSNASINGTKIAYDNLLGALAGINIYGNDPFDFEYRINASIKTQTILEMFIENWNSSVGFFSSAKTAKS